MMKLALIICSFFGSALALALQLPGPEIKIQCSVNYGYVETYSKQPNNPLKIWNQGTGFSTDGMFITRQAVTLYLEKDKSSAYYQFSFDENQASFLSRVCKESVSEIVRYTNSHKFLHQNLFHLSKDESGKNSGDNDKKIGIWTLRSWNLDTSVFDSYRDRKQ